jgi:hypothetical protein
MKWLPLALWKRTDISRPQFPNVKRNPPESVWLDVAGASDRRGAGAPRRAAESGAESGFAIAEAGVLRPAARAGLLSRTDAEGMGREMPRLRRHSTRCSLKFWIESGARARTVIKIDFEATAAQLHAKG